MLLYQKANSAHYKQKPRKKFLYNPELFLYNPELSPPSMD